MLSTFKKIIAGAKSQSHSSRRRISIANIPDIVYAVGDIHGCLKNLILLDNKILSEAKSLPGSKAIIYLGDYIDRGPHSAHVVEYFCRRINRRIDNDVTFINLAGNHEEMFLSFMESGGKNENWLAFGGIETLNSYGIKTASKTAYQLAIEALEAVPQSHLEFLRGLSSAAKLKNYWFVHGFVDPFLSFERQKEHTLLWSRPQDFKWPPQGTKFTVVHGHTPVEQVDIMENRINVDTAAFATGVLSGVRIAAGGVSAICSTI